MEAAIAACIIVLAGSGFTMMAAGLLFYLEGRGVISMVIMEIIAVLLFAQAVGLYVASHNTYQKCTVEQCKVEHQY